MKVSTITLGCKVNQYETQAMLNQLLQGGFSSCQADQSPDIILLNSCTVTSASDHKVRQTLRKSRRAHPHAVIVLTGCMPQAFPELARDLTDADIVLGNTNRSSLLPHILQYLSTRQRIIDIVPHDAKESFESMAVENFYERTRAFIKIQDGCNRFCSFCIIPYARGRVRSKPLEDITDEVTQLAQKGYREIVLTGINLSAYGQDTGLHLCDAVEAVCAVNGIERVRLGSLEPEQLSRDVIDRLAKQPKLCPQFHLSLQSGCDDTLKRMNRHYTTEEYRTIVQNLRAAFENAAITTDIMVGFPGETEEEFSQSLAFAEEIAFARVHVFAYSRRPGTKACDEPNQIPKKVKEARSKQMLRVTNETKQAFLKAQQGTVQAVLAEREIKPGIYEGYTANYTPVQFCCGQNPCGALVQVQITTAEEDHCCGEAVSIITPAKL